MPKIERCPECNRITRDGEKVSRSEYQKSPIWETDFSKPMSTLIEDIRTQLARVRGKLTDITHGYDCTDGYRLIKDVEGLLTCALVTLAYAKDERLKHEILIEDARKRRGEMNAD